MFVSSVAGDDVWQDGIVAPSDIYAGIPLVGSYGGPSRLDKVIGSLRPPMERAMKSRLRRINDPPTPDRIGFQPSRTRYSIEGLIYSTADRVARYRENRKIGVGLSAQ